MLNHLVITWPKLKAAILRLCAFLPGYSKYSGLTLKDLSDPRPPKETPAEWAAQVDVYRNAGIPICPIYTEKPCVWKSSLAPCKIQTTRQKHLEDNGMCFENGQCTAAKALPDMAADELRSRAYKELYGTVALQKLGTSSA